MKKPLRGRGQFSHHPFFYVYGNFKMMATESFKIPMNASAKVVVFFEIPKKIEKSSRISKKLIKFAGLFNKNINGKYQMV